MADHPVCINIKKKIKILTHRSLKAFRCYFQSLNCNQIAEGSTAECLMDYFSNKV